MIDSVACKMPKSSSGRQTRGPASSDIFQGVALKGSRGRSSCPPPSGSCHSILLLPITSLFFRLSIQGPKEAGSTLVNAGHDSVKSVRWSNATGPQCRSMSLDSGLCMPKVCEQGEVSSNCLAVWEVASVQVSHLNKLLSKRAKVCFGRFDGELATKSPEVQKRYLIFEYAGHLHYSRHCVVDDLEAVVSPFSLLHPKGARDCGRAKNGLRESSDNREIDAVHSGQRNPRRHHKRHQECVDASNDHRFIHDGASAQLSPPLQGNPLTAFDIYPRAVESVC